ncbi:hypothetical protein JXL21_09885 [Candidatus Bathyarchaeota archaeon]|nr:hypothetical protein [Candidatus Bathyarchaeota archaeon]
MYWLNVDLPTGAVKLHRDGCRYCLARETRKKGVNRLDDNGGWFSFESTSEAKEFFKKNHGDMIWVPCKVCCPEKTA